MHVTLKDDLSDKVADVFHKSWSVRIGRKVPDTDDLSLLNDAVDLPFAAVLYADIDRSSELVHESKWEFAAEIYKAFLYCAARVIGSNEGTVTAYDGDRVMGVFVGDMPCNMAVRSALQINWCVANLVMPLMRQVYDTSFELLHVTGVDCGQLRAARTGVRGANDIVWVGNAANFAAKLSGGSSDYSTYVTDAVYRSINNELKYDSNDGSNVWSQTYFDSQSVYRTSAQASLD